MTSNLARAIKLREWTRRADDIDDMDALRRLNRQADEAYLRLDPFEACAYLKWARAGFSLMLADLLSK